ncbi:hypothetical protein HKX48_007013 [Thoreauomyces humboldtii]|nr:hypothetical protein HKX48_007013 [Thoreauomyces humboldtii]
MLLFARSLSSANSICTTSPAQYTMRHIVPASVAHKTTVASAKPVPRLKVVGKSSKSDSTRPPQQLGIVGGLGSYNRWLIEDEALLIREVEKGTSFEQIRKKHFPNRGLHSVKAKWKQIRPDLAHGFFKAKEDLIILKEILRNKKNPLYTAAKLMGRTCHHVTQRYTQTWMPQLSDPEYDESVSDPNPKRRKAGSPEYVAKVKEMIERLKDMPEDARVPRVIKPWSTAEDQKLLKLVEQIGTRWTSIAMDFPQRSVNDVGKRWLTITDLAKRPERPWTPEEDAKLIEAAIAKRTNGRSWVRIGQELFPNRAAKQLSVRWEKIRPDMNHGAWSPEETAAALKVLKENNFGAPSGYALKNLQRLVFPRRHGASIRTKMETLIRQFHPVKWTPEMDRLLASCVKEHGRQTQSYVEQFPGILVRDLHKRWYTINPQWTVKQWTDELDAQLIELTTTKGKKWLEIADALAVKPGMCRARFKKLSTGNGRSGRAPDGTAPVS